VCDANRLPPADQLDEALRPLTRRQAVRIAHEKFARDAEALAGHLKTVVEPTSGTRPSGHSSTALTAKRRGPAPRATNAAPTTPEPSSKLPPELRSSRRAERVPMIETLVGWIVGAVIGFGLYVVTFFFTVIMQSLVGGVVFSTLATVGLVVVAWSMSTKRSLTVEEAVFAVGTWVGCAFAFYSQLLITARFVLGNYDSQYPHLDLSFLAVVIAAAIAGTVYTLRRSAR
jgi:hypothetical protein